MHITKKHKISNKNKSERLNKNLQNRRQCVDTRKVYTKYQKIISEQKKKKKL